MAGKGGIARHHLALGPRLAKAGHGVAEAFDMVGQQRAQGGAQVGQGAVLILGQGGKIGVNLGGHRGNLGMGRLPILRGPPGAV